MSNDEIFIMVDIHCQNISDLQVSRPDHPYK